jgi:hypothetical protein
MARFHDWSNAEVSSQGESAFADDESTAFVLVAHGPPVSSSEVESSDADALEVRVFWDRAMLATHFVGREGSVVVGDHEDSIARIPESALGVTALEIARATTTGFLVNVPRGASARVGRPARAVYVEGPHDFETSRGDAITMTLGNFRIELLHGGAGKGVPQRTWLERVRDSATQEVAGAALFHAVLFGAIASYAPLLLGDDASSIDRADQIQLMQRYLAATAERERAPEASAPGAGDNSPAGGSRAEGAEGKMGKRDSLSTSGRAAKQGTSDDRLPVGKAGRAGFEFIGIVAQSAGDPNEPTAPWARLDAGADRESVTGDMWAPTIGETRGFGGLAPSGTGDGGGGDQPWVGLDLNRIGREGNGLGPPGSGIGGKGWCVGCTGPGHAPRTPSLRQAGVTTLTGQMPAEVIQRVVRDNFGRFRGCYEAGLRDNPALEGRVVTRFAIDRQGVVSMVQDGGSSLPNPGVVACVLRSFYSLTFPEHEGGIVTVVYPLALRPE